MPNMFTWMLCFLLFLNVPAQAFEINFDLEQWKQKKGDHFVVYYTQQSQEQDAGEILRHAEEDYERILDRIGAKKVDNFWTWDDRVKIVYYPDAQSFVKATGQPSWSKGVSLSHASNFKMRLIVSFQGQDDFLGAVLPHEISHLVMHDFMRNKPMPRWFDEGVAQLDESNNNEEHRKLLAKLIESNRGIPFAMLDAFPSMISEDPMKAAIFYAESLYIVDFLIKTYGKDNFAELCRLLRDGQNFEAALAKAYYPTIDSWQTLEAKWNQYMLSFVHI